MTDDLPGVPWLQISRCVQHIGTVQFNTDLIQLLTDFLFVDQCMVFTYAEAQQMKCLMSINFQNEKLAVPLAGDYINEGYQKDPNLEDIKKLTVEESLTIRLSSVIDLISKTYKTKYYSQPSIADKVSHIQNVGGLVYYFNFYRGQEKGPIIQTDLIGDDSFVSLLSNIMLLHFEKRGSSDSYMPLSFLSDRERQVCEGILKGQKTDFVAHVMGISPHTVTTYRKRAYRKLGISSRGELFLLCT
ncbi:helix-turn-helix transcriptional regulator [Paremcibacter congregatus]|uniref:HTH luxR-type domain-containing protein n=1 Tax=Paremcibacter congregatus TaxID=2043170 RepID=A0A2G4YSA5_9PROT|nr:helix-turn-helix transcriptional regulator [Paremcibacter congregatus]PHZ85147.1 hypothetical protein CRD36_06960 [Paremcibacter congregatus]QDE27917.1 helix-turn-helix transcriptional regulator [Paremcibacter congregatus]